MGIVFTLIDPDDRRIRSIHDGLGIIFDAAGGFDRLIDYHSPFPTWQSLDPDGTVLISARCKAITGSTSRDNENAEGSHRITLSGATGDTRGNVCQ